MEPILVHLEKDKSYSWCRCGLSLTQPFCDGAHKGTGEKSLRFEVQQSGDHKLCVCKESRNPPFCDGSHANVCA